MGKKHNGTVGVTLFWKPSQLLVMMMHSSSLRPWQHVTVWLQSKQAGVNIISVLPLASQSRPRSNPTGARNMRTSLQPSGLLKTSLRSWRMGVRYPRLLLLRMTQVTHTYCTLPWFKLLWWYDDCCFNSPHLFGPQTTFSALTVSGGSTRVQLTDTSSSARSRPPVCPTRAS